MTRLTKLAVLTGIVSAAMIASASAQKWDMPTAYAASNFHSQNNQQFADELRAATNGALDITVHPAGSLFGGAEIKRAVQTGQAPIGERLLSAHQNENPIFGLDSVPFLATSFADSATLWEAMKPVISKILLDQNLVLLYSVPWPPQGLYFDRDINSVADMAGIRFRAYNASTARLAELAGMSPVQIEAAELKQALATGVAEAFISSGSTGVDRQVWEELSNFYDVQAWLPRNYVFVNKAAWDELDAATQAIVRDIAAKAEARGTAASEALSGQLLDTLASHGMSVEPPSPQLFADLQEIGQTMTAEWLDAAGDQGADIIAAYQALR